MTSEQGHYIIRSGMPGRERLRILAAIFHETTTALLRRAGIGPGMTCLDLGCGGAMSRSSWRSWWDRTAT
jgi:hypothetical protein